MRNVFLRAQQMTAEISGEKVVCRGVVHRLKEDKTALQAETETFGGAMKPLYVYFGDGKVLPGEFTLQTGGARYTHCVLKAASENKLVIEAGACEKITQRTQSGTEA